MSAPGEARRSGGNLAGSRLGDYELLSLLGSGGMGVVYRARDTRMRRDVAVKILPAELASDSRRLQRFEREARTASALNHPAIVTVYEIGSADSVSYIAMELVEGRTLRSVLSAGPLPAKKILDLATPLAQGLARAHEAGIVHRDLKPENIMVSSDGHAKILDFGLAKWTPFEGGADLDASTLPASTEPGVVLGTVGYMSPEQATGRKVDFRSDQFALGSILYEMATGRKAFEKPSKPETLAAIIREEPEPIASVNPRAPAPLRWIIEQCLAKDPRDRYASTADLARDLSRIRDHLSEATSSVSGETLAAGYSRRRALLAATGATLVLAAAAVAFLAGRSTGKSGPPKFHQITLRGEGISSARFAPDGHTIVYAASVEGKPAELYLASPESPEVRSLGVPRADILSVSRAAEMAILLGRGFVSSRGPHIALALPRDPRLVYGTLARVPLAGGAPREILENVSQADWAPDGEALAVSYQAGVKFRLDYPIGKTLYESASSWVNHPRVSPDGQRVAFNATGSLKVADLQGHIRDLAEGAWEIAWGPGGNEIWFSELASSGTTEISAVTIAGRRRVISYLPGDFVLHDVSRDGRLLLARVFESSEIFGTFPGEARERNLSWLDRAVAVDLSADGSVLLINEMRSEKGRDNAIYVRGTDGSAPVRLADGLAVALSSDGRFVLAWTPRATARGLLLIPTRAGQPRKLEIGDLIPGWAGFFPDGKRIFFMGDDLHGKRRAYVMDLAGGKPRPISPDGVRRGRLSGDGRFVLAGRAEGEWWLYPTEPGPASRVAGLEPGEEPIRWSGDGKSLYVRGADQLQPGDSRLVTRVYRLDPWSGRRQLWKEIPPAAGTAGGSIETILFAAEGKICVYTHHRFATDLFLAEGLR